MRLAIIIALLTGVALAGYYIGVRANDAKDERAKAATLERTQNADISKGDAKADIDWIRDFVDGL